MLSRIFRSTVPVGAQAIQPLSWKKVGNLTAETIFLDQNSNYFPTNYIFPGFPQNKNAYF